MSAATYTGVTGYVRRNGPEISRRMLACVRQLELGSLLVHQNPYLWRLQDVHIVTDVVVRFVDRFLLMEEEVVLRELLSGLAVYICSKAYGGRKSSAEGIDLEFERASKRYIVSIKSGPNWGNSSQIRRMRDCFLKAKRILRTNSRRGIEIVAVNGCCYGRDDRPDKGDYHKLCGQRFWSLIGGDGNLYLEIVEPLGRRAKVRNEAFAREYARLINKLTLEFSESFCDPDGRIKWEDVVRFNSAARRP